MGTILASELIAAVRDPIFDKNPASQRWSDLELLALLNAGQRQAAIFKPDVSVKNAVVQLVAGPLQAIPADGTAFVRLTCNMGGGATPGRAIQYEDFDGFSKRNPFWQTSDPSPVVRYYLYIKEDPRNFYIYPPQPSSGMGYVREVYGSAAVPVSDPDSPINIDDVYSDALVDYMAYAVSEVEEYVNPYAAARSVKHWNKFVSALGRMDLLKKELMPKKTEG
jgi:hypothetical protein